MKRILYLKPNFDFEWEEAKRYPELKELGYDKWLQLVQNNNKNYIVKFSEIKDNLGNVDLDFDNLDIKKRIRFFDSFFAGKIELPIVIKFDENDYDLLSGNTRLAGLIKYGFDPCLCIIDLRSLL
jgi:hypothetical protein